MDPQTKLRWDPAFLGPLDDEFAPVTGEDRCFAGEETYLSRRKLDARERLWDRRSGPPSIASWTPTRRCSTSHR